MSSASQAPIILIIGAGPNVGQKVARAFAAKGYRVALSSRKAPEKDVSKDYFHVPSDLSQPDSVIRVFSKVKEALGYPSVVVYNAAAGTVNEAHDPLSIPLSDFARDLAINTTSVFVAAQQAVLGFAELPDLASRTFIFTGNILNTTIIAKLMDSGVGKSGTAHMIRSAAAAYVNRGFKFYYADERKSDGSAAYFYIDGDAHAEHYVQLAESKEQGSWQQTFVKGVGYRSFSDSSQ